jgi:plastocyanin
VASVVAALHSSLSGPTSRSATSAVVVEKGSRFVPSTVKIRVGGTVTFENLDTVTHRVVIGATDLGLQRPGQNVAWTAASPGDIAFSFAPLR